MKRILFILDNYYPHIGGAEKLFQNLAEELVRRGDEVTVLTPKILPDYRGEEVINGVSIVRQWVPGFLQRYFFTFLSIAKAVKLARQHDIIHTTVYNSAFPAWIAAKLTGKKAIITIHEVWNANWFRFGDSWLLSAVLFLLERITMSLKFDGIVCVSDSTVREYRKIYPARSVVRIYPGVVYEELNDVPRLSGPERLARKQQLGFSATDFLVLGFGRTALNKGFEHLVEAVPHTSRQLPQARFMFVWPEAHNFISLRDKLVARLATIADSSAVQVHDKKSWPDLLALIQTADCIVIPSLSEGFGYVVVESCCLGQRVIASNTASIPEVIGGNYRLVEPADPDAIAAALVAMAADRYDVAPIPTQFTVGRMTDAHLDLYHALTATPAPAAFQS